MKGDARSSVQQVYKDAEKRGGLYEDYQAPEKIKDMLKEGTAAQ